MDSSNSKNMTLILLLLVVVGFVFTFLFFQNNTTDTIETNITQGIEK